MSRNTTKRDRRLVAVLAAPLPIAVEPFAPVAAKLGVSQQDVVDSIADLMRRGIVRRFGGVLKHDKAGFRCNAMVAFDVPARRCKKAGAAVVAFPFVTHCYRRKTYKDWPYSLYAMVHARSKGELERSIMKLKREVKSSKTIVLPTVREFKKTTFGIDNKIVR
jgi:DNA-binding Lrp family transcriptional regulator